MSRTAKRSVFAFALALLLTATAVAQEVVSVRELVPSAAPAGARVMVTGRGLNDPAITIVFSPGESAVVIERTDRSIEAIVPPNAVTGNVRISLGSSLLEELRFTVTDPEYTVTTLAGGPRTKNNPLKHPWAASVVLPGGGIAVADEQHHQIDLVTPAGAVSVLAGNGKQGLKDGTGSSASFKNPRGITFDPVRKTLYVSDSGNNAIRRVTLDGIVTTVAGDGKQGSNDGTGATARFKAPYGLAIGTDGAIYVADSMNNVIRHVTPEGVVTTFAGTGSKGDRPTDGALLSATFNEPRGIVAMGADFFVADTKNNAIRRIANGLVSTVIAFPRTGDDDTTDDGVDGDPAVLRRPTGIGADEAGNIIVSDSLNDFIRTIVLSTTPPTLRTIAGNGKHGWADGDAATAQFKDPVGLTVAGAIYVADEDNDALRRLCPEVSVTGLVVPVGRLVAGTEIRLFGTGFVPGGTTVTLDGVAATEITWITSTTLAVRIPQAITGGSVAVAVTACGGSAGPTDFVVDNTPPVLTITNAGAPLTDGSMFKVPVVPILSATDDFDPAPVVTATLNGSVFTSGTAVGSDGVYELVATAEDAAGNRATQTVHFTIDATPPVVEVLEGATPFPTGFWFNRAVTIDAKVTDLTTTTTESRIDGQHYDLRQPYGVEGSHELTVSAVDALGNATTIGPLAFTIDLTPPALTFTSHTNGQTVTGGSVTITGGSDDSVSVKVNGLDAVVDPVAKTFTSPFSLMEGENTITAIGVDRAGNSGTATLKLVLDTRAPELTLEAIASCTHADTLDLRGTVSDPALDKISVRIGDVVTPAVISGTTWSARIELGSEGRKSIVVEATDKSGHTATESAAILVDRTASAITLTESGAPFDATIAARPVSLFFRATDADTDVTAAATLDGVPYTAGTEIREEKTHTIRVTARDCAGNDALREQTFLIDLTPPRFLSFSPASGSTVSQVPASLTGTVDSDAVEVRLADASVGVPVQNGAFTMSAAFAEGVNERSLEVVDRAGHVGNTLYTLGIRTTEPLVDIVEGGVSLVDGTVFMRPVRPEVRVFEEGVTFTATLDGAPFVNDTDLTADKSYTIVATAADPAYGTSRTVTRHFTIDRSGPAVTITSPADGAAIDAASTDVHVNAADAVSVNVNGVDAVKQGGSWIAVNVPLEIGENLLVATGRDAAGNQGSDTAEVTRTTAGPALVLTFPPDPYLTNRPRIDISGRVLRPNSTVAVTVPPAAPVTVATDPAGVFRLSGAMLQEGDVTIDAVASEGGQSVHVSARVTADFTPPKVRLLESGEPFSDGANFDTQAVISADAADNGQPVEFVLTIDGEEVASPRAVTANGGHTAAIMARDAAGNEAKLERTFYIGGTAGGGCGLDEFDPADGTVIASSQVGLIGRSGGAAGVKVNGVAARTASGSFSSTVELPQEGANIVTIVCTDADGTPVGDPKKITLIRVTNDPSVTISSPTEDYATHDATLTVTGTLGNGAVSVELNGKPATISGSNWTVTDVRLSDGINVLVARAKNDAGRTAIASRRVTYIEDAPAIAITSPIPGFVTGQAKTDVSGTYSNVDPASLAIEGLSGAIDAMPWSDTTGEFVAREVTLVSGENTIAVNGRSRTGRTARSVVTIKYLATVPVITITEPDDNRYFGASAGDNFRVSGTFAAADGSTVDVNSVPATIDASAKTFVADVPFSTAPGGMTPVVARLAQPNGEAGGFDSIRVMKLGTAPKVIDTFPIANAAEVDPGVVVLVLFSSPMELTSTKNAFRLDNGTGSPMSGKLYLDKDVLTFAPATTLTPGERYTIRVSTDAKDLAGQNLAAASETSFVVATSAPSTPPTLTTASGTVCAQTVDVAGTTAPGARVKIDYGTIYFTTTASATGAFTYKVPLSGQQGFQVIRVRTMGADGSLSPAAELELNVDCTGPRVLDASYDRTSNKLTIVFSRDVKTSTLTTGTTGNLQLSFESRIIGGAVAANGATVVLTPEEDLTQQSFTLKVLTGVEDANGRHLEFPYTKLLYVGDGEPQPGNGGGYITGEVYDATTGRPLPNASVTIEVPVGAFSAAPRVASNAVVSTQSIAMQTDARGRYGDQFPEGAYTIKATRDGYTSVWRQIIVPAGAGVIPIDIRLTHRGETQSVSAGELTLTHGGTNAVARRAQLTIPAGAMTAGAEVTLTATGAQSLAGLLPLGWSPLASAEIVSTGSLRGQLTFDVPQSQIVQAGQSLTAARYDEARDEWRVIVAVVNVATDKASFEVDAAGAYALVYPDKRPGLTVPAQPRAGAPLQGVVDACAAGSCPGMIANSFPLDPEVVLPSGSTVATLNIEGADPHVFASGTAVQAYIDEERRLADGGRELDLPFATDLVLYRDLAGNEASATFNLAPSGRAAEVLLEVGFDHIRVLPYPGRLDRGTLIGPEGGRVPADDVVSVEIPTGAAQDALRATATSIANVDALGSVNGYTVLAGLQLTLQRASQPAAVDIDGDGVTDPIAPVELSRPARATFTVDAAKLPAGTPQLILAEIVDPTPFGNRIFRLAAEMTPLDGGRWTTQTIDRERLPIDGILREGRYVLLAANAPIAFAKGVVRLGTNIAVAEARVTTPQLGVADLSRLTGIFALPVPATPAAPFALVPRTVALGDGSAYTHSSAPAAGEVVNVGDLVIVAQPPHVTSTIPAANATDVALSTSVEVSFTPGIDPSSVDANSLLVIDTTDNHAVAGNIAAVGTLGIRWTPPAGETLKQGRRYAVAVSPTVRGTNGTPLGQTYTFSFTTVAVVTNSEIHPERVRITIPDTNGVSRIVGDAGALKAGWVAIPVRHGSDFLTKYSATAAGDGSFSLTIGDTPRDRVTIEDVIDLRVLNTAGALAAIIPLTPFTSEDGRAFIAPAGNAVSFVSVDGIGIGVPAGAFDVATRIDVAPAPASTFSEVPRISNELILGAAVNVQFNGRAKKPLELSLPMPAGADPAREFFLAILGQSLRGPRLMAVDTLAIANGRLTTVPQVASGARAVRANGDVTRGNGPKDYLQKFIQAGQYAALQMHPDAGTLAWSFMNTGATVYELVWDTLQSMYVGHQYLAESGGRIAFPVPAGTQFTVTGYDPATSLEMFEQTYASIPIGGNGVVLSPPDQDFNGPYPVYASPFRVENTEAPPLGVTLKAVRDVQLSLSSTGLLTIAGTGSLTATTNVTALDIDSGERRGPQPLPITLPDTKTGDRIVLMIDEKEIDPSASVSVVFNEPIDIGTAATDEEINDFLKSVIKFEQADNPAAAGVNLLDVARLRLDSGSRRVTILLPSPLEAGVKFRLTLDDSIRDRSGNGLAPGQAGKKDPSTGSIVPIGSAAAPIEMWFETRKPKGTFAEFDIRQSGAAQFGSIRETAQFGNLLFVAALDGGVLAYDMSDPAALDGTSTKPIAIAPGRDEVTKPITDYWTVQVDHHGRVFSTGLTNLFGAIRTWRVEDFTNATTTPGDCLPTISYTVCKQTGGAIISQAPSSAYGVGLPSAFVTMDRVEAIPRKMKILVGDAPTEDWPSDVFVSTFCDGSSSDAGNGLQKCVAKIPASGSSYRIQRITVENRNLALQWSEDAIDSGTANVGEVLFAPGDVLHVSRNLSTYAVVNLFGWGIGVFDVNAIESNEVAGTPPVPMETPQEQVALRAYADDPSIPDDVYKVGDLAYSPDSEILAGGGGARVYVLDTRKGAVEFGVTPPSDITLLGKSILTGGVNPRWELLKNAIEAATGTPPVARFSTAATYTNSNSGRSYLLMTAMDFGLIALEAGGLPLSAESFADAVYIPGGARAVRVIERTNMAAVADNEGYVYLVDLARIDERAVAGTDLFPTVAAALSSGTQDPRILWKSDDPIAVGNIGPLVDPDTGIIIGADLLAKRVRIGSAIDPKFHVMANMGEPRLKEVGSVIPLGIETPEGLLSCSDATKNASCRASLGVFRIEASLPGSMTESLPGGFAVAIESEGVPGAETMQTPEPYPVSHLRQSDRNGAPSDRPTNGFVMNRVLAFPPNSKLRFQKGWNRFASDWIVAIADPRAAKDYGTPPADCPACNRPLFVSSLPGTVRELYTLGRFIAIRPELSSSGAYGFLASGKRLETRISTTPADTVRPIEALVAAQAAPVAEGMLQDTTYMHSGEIETSAVDYDAGGRAGWNVVLDRTYRSRTVGLTPFGSGWDSALFRRLRALPNGDIEYRDGAEVWRFRLAGTEYKAPEGLFLRLTKREGGWSLIDQQLRITRFDDYGRLVAESDEFYTPRDAGSGNTIQYIYDDRGRLVNVVDPVGRTTEVHYTSNDLVDYVQDWHEAAARVIDYNYTNGILTTVKLPEVVNTSGTRPQLQYTYTAAGSSYRQKIESATNLDTITDAGMSRARVDFDYDGNDRVLTQKWVTGESATFQFGALPATASVTDILGQQRTYTLTGANSATDPLADRVHTKQIDDQVDVWAAAAFGQLPAGPLTAGEPGRSTRTRTRKYDYTNGVLSFSQLDGVRMTTNAVVQATGAPGYIVNTSTTGPEGVTAAAAAASFLPATTAISRTFNYQSGSGVFIDSIKAGEKTIFSPEPHRGKKDPEATNSAVTTQESYYSNGLLKAVNASGGTDSSSAGASQTINYFTASDARFKRGLPQTATDGSLVTKYDYTETAATEVDPRGVTTTTTFDTWNRPTEVRVSKPGETDIVTTYSYEASGRLHDVTRTRDGGDATTTYTYDLLGRPYSVTENQIATVGSRTTTTTYELGSRTVTTDLPGGARNTKYLDRLGRVIRSVTETGSSPIEEQYAYDLAGNQVFVTDLYTASATAYDAHGRAIGTKAPDGTISTTGYDEWSRATSSKQLADDASTVVGQSTYGYTDAGRLQSTTTTVDDGKQRKTTFAWDGGGRTTGTATGDRASHSKYDLSGRPTEQAAGGGDATNISDAFSKTTFSGWDGTLPSQSQSEEKNGGSYSVGATRDIAGRVKQQDVGSLTWKQKFDELGNLRQQQVPGRPATNFNVDARGAVTTETLPDGSTNTFEYDGSGAQKNYTDPSSEPTSTRTDFLGRPTRRDYADGTYEETEWEGARVHSVRDRQGRKQVYVYNVKGQLDSIQDATGAVIDKLTYDNAGRLTSWKNADTEIVWGDFNLEGLPKSTTQRRFRNATGLDSSPDVLDEFKQTHSYNEHGERTDFTMPAYSGFAFAAGWTSSVHQDYDAMGNVVSVGSVMTATYRNAGRPETRTVTTSGGATIVRSYGYHRDSSLMKRMSVAANGVVVAGSDVSYDGLQKSSAQLLGVSSGSRYMQWRYDNRSRLLASAAGTDADADPLNAVPGRAKEEVDPADFRTGQARESQFDAGTTAALQAKGVNTAHLDPPSATFDQQPGGGHKIGQVTKGPKVYPFAWNGAERHSDGRFEYVFDAKGRLLRATELGASSQKRRLVYTYSGTGRLVGRRAEYATVASPSDADWKVEDRPTVIAADGLPAETTFVWDPISDNLLEVFKAGATPSDPQGGLLKQVIHGGASYDDPIETATFDRAGGKVMHLYPVYDEAGAGSLQVVLNEQAQVVARTLPNDAYGAENIDFTGAAIDGAAVKVKKDSSGGIEEVEVTLHATEQLLAASANGGARLASVDASGNLVRTTSATASVVSGDEFTLSWTLTPSQWAALTDPTDASVGGVVRTPASLSIAATDTLRAAAWSFDVPVLPAPEWATATGGTVYSSGTLPVELREPLPSLASFVDSIADGETKTSTIYKVENLALVSVGGSAEVIEDVLAARMHAHPFTDPTTGLNYVRSRWYDPGTGTWLTPDPRGYQDSANLYAGFAGDPINNRDPRGEQVDGTSALKAGEEAARWTPVVIAGGKAAGGGSVVAGGSAATAGGTAGTTVAAGVVGGLLVAAAVVELFGDDLPIYASDESVRQWWHSALKKLPRWLAEQAEELGRARIPLLPGYTVYGHMARQLREDNPWRQLLAILHNNEVSKYGSPAPQTTHVKTKDAPNPQQRTTPAIVQIAGSDIRHQNGTIAEWHGWQEALANGDCGIQAPGKITEPGPDFITYSFKEDLIIVWDAKFSSSGRYPKSVPASQLGRWMAEVRQAINALPNSPTKSEILEALAEGRVVGRIFPWP